MGKQAAIKRKSAVTISSNNPFGVKTGIFHKSDVLVQLAMAWILCTSGIYGSFNDKYLEVHAFPRRQEIIGNSNLDQVIIFRYIQHAYI